MMQTVSPPLVKPATDALSKHLKEPIRVSKVELRSVAPLPLAVPFADATMEPMSHYRPVFLRITDADGHWGECEYPASGLALLQYVLRPLLFAQAYPTYATLFERLYWAIRNEGFRGSAALCLGHVDRAMIDLFARRHGRAAYRYLGGTSPVVRVYASGGGVNLSDEAAGEEAQRIEAAGYETIKIKFGGRTNTLATDLRRIRLIRSLLKDETELAIDANQALGLEAALELTNALRGEAIAWLEEPVHSADLNAIKTLCAVSTIPISYGESERSELVFPVLADFGVHHLQPIAGHVSGLHQWGKVARLARRRGLRFTSGGTSYFNASFVAALGEQGCLEFLMPVLRTLEPILALAPEERGGSFTLSEEPGIGCQVDWALLARCKQIRDSVTWKD